MPIVKSRNIFSLPLKLKREMQFPLMLAMTTFIRVATRPTTTELRSILPSPATSSAFT